MMVTFVSECEKKSLNKTRRVLDAFANRIGTRTWQTVITNEGLQAVKKLLRKTASKNTAVSCHWIRSRSRSELVWVVGNRLRFDLQGNVPVNTTKKTIMNTQWENDWHYLPLIKSLSGLAALFHDWGKASKLFQEKLKPNHKKEFKGDPLRHEWISTLFLNDYVNGETDKQWLTRLAEGEFDVDKLKAMKNKKKPLTDLPEAAGFLAWLIISHHRLPLNDDPYWKGEKVDVAADVFKKVTQQWGYENKFDEAEFEKNIKDCFEYKKGLPSESEQWLRYAKRQAKKLMDCLPLLNKSIEDGTWRLILHYARLCLMLGDHTYSSMPKDERWRSNLDLYANTDRESNELKQKLDEHLVGVAKKTIANVHLLPAFENKKDELQRVYDVNPLKKKSPDEFRWQDISITKIKAWRKENSQLDTHHFGFFSVNMASTGKGKTFANAKIMQALSPDEKSLRYILALGLRTLTLQTGDEYRERIKLEKDELAILIGSHAVIELHNKNKTENIDAEKNNENVGSESLETLLDNEVYFESEIPEDNLVTLLKNKKDRLFLYAPVLSCTIDHLMAATETKRGGRYILPSLRLMSSDLVIDEIDDFDGIDLIAIGRLIHLAGMLGRKVMISSATIPPDLAEGYYNVYQSGWKIFAQARDRSPIIGCAWIDEFTTKVHSINCKKNNGSIKNYQKNHQDFIKKRITELKKELPKRKVNIVTCEIIKSDDVSIRDHYYSTIQRAIIEKHKQHYSIDEKTKNHVSFGVVRVANIKPCIELTRYLLNAKFPEDIEIRTMAYHSQQVLIMRSEQEKHLDTVLKRKKGVQAAFDHPIVREHLNNTTTKNIIFILVATPVEEVGRDHDFDWAVIEPSSYRSIVQLAGRVLRHRNLLGAGLQSPNIALMQYNLKGMSEDKNPVFCYPGYESSQNRLKTHNLNKLLDLDSLAERLDAQARISKRKILNPQSDLVDLEHECIHQWLSNYDKYGPETMQGWLTSCWWLTAIPQLYIKFRAGSPQVHLYLIPDGDGFRFVEKGRYGEKPIPRENLYGIKKDETMTDKEKHRLWLSRDYGVLLGQLGKFSLERAALVFGEISLPVYDKDLNNLSFVYSSQFGLMKK